MLSFVSMETVKKGETEDLFEIGSAVESFDIPDLTSGPRNLEGNARRLDYEIRSLTAWARHGWVFNPAAEPAPQLLKALQIYNENKPAKGPHPWKPLRHTLCHTLAKWLLPRLPQQRQFNNFHEKLTKPEEIEALSIQMFVNRLTKKQDKHLVRIRPHLAARVAWNKAVEALDDFARCAPLSCHTCSGSSPTSQVLTAQLHSPYFPLHLQYYHVLD